MASFLTGTFLLLVVHLLNTTSIYSACDVITESETDSTKMKVLLGDLCWCLLTSLPMIIWVNVYTVYKRHHSCFVQTDSKCLKSACLICKMFLKNVCNIEGDIGFLNQEIVGWKCANKCVYFIKLILWKCWLFEHDQSDQLHWAQISKDS